MKHSNGHVAEQFVGRPDLRAVLAPPVRNLSSTGLFANEPSAGSRINAELDAVRTRGALYHGRKLRHYIRAVTLIERDTEILVCYGSLFKRVDYASSCDCSRCVADLA